MTQGKQLLMLYVLPVSVTQSFAWLVWSQLFQTSGKLPKNIHQSIIFVCTVVLEQPDKVDLKVKGETKYVIKTFVDFHWSLFLKEIKQ